MSNPRYGLAAAAVVSCALSACLAGCKTQRTVTWERGGAPDKLTERFVGQSMEKWNDGERHAMDRQRTSPERIFGGKRDNSQFGGEDYGTKKFRGSGEKFSGNKRYEPDTYQFVRDRELAREAAAAAGKQYGDAGAEAPESRRGWFGRDKSVATKSAYGSDKKVASTPLAEAERAQELNRERGLDIVNPSGSEYAPKELSIDEVRKILGR